MEDDEIVERYIVILLGVKDECLPSTTHLQKELFMLTKIDPSLESIFDYDNYNFGIYSELVAEKIEEPFYLDGAYEINLKNQICLTQLGKELYQEIIHEKDDIEDISFKHFIGAISLIRQIYDKLTVRELELIMYLTYPMTTKNSTIIEGLLKDKKKILDGLLKKGRITQDRYREMLNYEL